MHDKFTEQKEMHLFGEDLIEVLGSGAFLLAILAAFWKGDDAISDEFREDISLRLMLAEPPDKSTLDLRHIVLLWLNFTFGDRHLSFKCILTSTLLSSFLFLVTFYFFTRFSLTHRLFADPEFLIIIFGMLCFVNIVADYVSLLKSRKLLRNNRSPVQLLFLDVLLTTLIFIAVLALSFLLLDASFREVEVEFNGTAIPEISISIFTKTKSFNTQYFVFSAYLTTFITVTWSILVLVGYYTLRSAEKIIPTIKYALPITTKPLRSIGVFLTVISAVSLILMNGVQNFN